MWSFRLMLSMTQTLTSLDLNDLKNCPPVSNLSFFPKVACRSTDISLDKNHVSDLQIAYCPGRSNGLDDEKILALTLLDLSAAFGAMILIICMPS